MAPAMVSPVSVAAVFLFVFAVLAFIIRRIRFRLQGIPPGNLGLPLIGETLQLIGLYKTDNPEPFIDERVKRFGSVFTTHVFGEPTIFSTDPELNRFVLQNEGKLFECSYPASLSNLMGRHSLLLMKGALHKRMHSFVMSFANSSILKDHLLNDIDRLVRFNMNSWSHRILLMEETKKISFQSTMKMLMSVDPGEWCESLRKEYHLVVDGFFTVPYPLISPTYRKAIRARGKVVDALSVVVRKRRAEGLPEKYKDMLAALLASEDGFSDEEIVDFMVALLIAGYETSSTLMTLTVKFLTDTPLALAQLREEQDKIRSTKKESESIQWEDYKSMAFTQCVGNETLRMANIISGIFRRAMTDIKMKDYTIPKGWKIFTSFRGVHLDPNHYEDARTFSPWRWQSKVVTTSPHNVFTPFGGGQRLCPGYELARVALSVFLHHLVTRFSWVPAEEDKLVFFPTTRTQKQFPLIVKRRDLSKAM